MARTAYWVIDLASYATPTNAQIAAGQRTGSVAALKAGSEAFAATSGSGTITEATAVTGLTAGTEYRLSWTIYDDVALDYPASAPQHHVWVVTALAGVAVTSSAGTLTVSAGASSTLTGAAGASAVGALTAAGAATKTLTGATSTSSAGTVSATAAGNAAVTLTGASSTSNVGALTAAGTATKTLTGATTTSSAGTLTATAGGNAAVTLASTLATASAGIFVATGGAAITLTGASIAASAGAVLASVGTNAAITLTGAAVSATVGALQATGSAQIVVTGVQVSASAGTLSAAGGGASVGSAADVWNYVLSNGLTAEQTLVAVWQALSTPTEIADAILNRDFAAVADTNARTLLQAARFLRNRWSIAGTTLTVCEEDDATPAWTATVTAAPGADPISGTDPT